jgi:hypothetical protein
MTLGISPVTGIVYSGRVDPIKQMWIGKKTDVTNDFLRCVIEKSIFHGGSFEISGGGEVYKVTVEKIKNEIKE